MKLAILCQEEPVFLGPFLQDVIALRPNNIVAVFITGRRSGGEKKGTFKEKWESLQSYWLILEPLGFFQSLFWRGRARVLGAWDPRSVAGTAKRWGIPVHIVSDPNGQAFFDLLRGIQPDAILNQSERMLKGTVLSIPPFGFVNRHASLLPAHRGRLASFWSHSENLPRYGTTIHRVDEGVDTGPILVQEENIGINPASPYPIVMRALCEKAPALLWKALDLLETENFKPLPNVPFDKPRKFPTLAEAKAYRALLAKRRSRSLNT